MTDLMDCITSIHPDIVNTIADIDGEITEECNKENADKQKIFQLRYQQMIKGMYLNQNGINQY